jgi:hypothetical protein
MRKITHFGGFTGPVGLEVAINRFFENGKRCMLEVHYQAVYNDGTREIEYSALITYQEL